jgi:hypothetical protein
MLVSLKDLFFRKSLREFDAIGNAQPRHASDKRRQGVRYGFCGNNLWPFLSALDRLARS